MTLAFSGAPLNFTPQPEPPVHELVEYKACEGYGCGRFFYRPRPASVREGERICAGCREKEQAASEQGRPEPKIDGRRKHKVARLDFLMKPPSEAALYAPSRSGLAVRGGRLVKIAELSA